MDNPKVYGRQAFCLTFGEAARRNIICNYKVIISVITSEMVTNELLSRGEVVINGDAIRARQVANQIALRDAVEKYGVSKIFTFHKTVKSAASFVAAGNEGVRTHLPSFGAFHVNGEMPTARRERVMREFRGANCAVMSNARCLTEGVDVPAVDMVAFLSPRRSRVDIVQAAGRAMRRAPGKTMGYVLVPLYVELTSGESVDDAVSRADFDEVWDVLQSLQEQDEALAELIRHVGEQKGRGLGFDDRGFGDKIDFGGPRLTLESLRAAVTTRCLENLYASWDVWFGKLKAFKDRFGHCKIPQNWEEPGLASWISRQRLQKDNLASDQLKRLDDIGFVWDLTALAWDEMFAKLVSFKDRFGHCNVEANWEEDPSLSRWVSVQRNRKKRGFLNDERISHLEQLGFVWDYQKVKGEKTWLEWYRKLEDYTRRHGDPHVLRTYSDKRLASWVWNQRQRRKGTLKKKGKNPDLITPEQIVLLDKLGFYWDARDLKCHQLDHELQVARGIKPQSDGSMKDLERAFQEMLEKYGDSFKNPFGWAAATLGQKNPQFRDLEESLGQNHMRVIYKRASHKIHAAANGVSTSLGTQSFGPNAPMLRTPIHKGLGDPAILCARSLSQTSAVITTLFINAECLIEINLFAELVGRIEKTFDRLAEQKP